MTSYLLAYPVARETSHAAAPRRKIPALMMIGGGRVGRPHA